MPTKSDITMRAPDFSVVTRATSAGSLTSDMWLLSQRLHFAQTAAAGISLFSQCNDETGGYITLDAAFQFIPVLIGARNTVVPLFEFVEVLDGLLDYDEVLKEIPSLSHAQIGGAMSFLRSVTQTNPGNLDIDEQEDAALLSSESFLTEVRTALADKEISRVLHRD
jgi:hypothetical protein